ncbi:MAG: hypothetical protein SOZ58_11645 [Prevotella sp.]|nr:hypothetical protein [Prevotella sp.]
MERRFIEFGAKEERRKSEGTPQQNCGERWLVGDDETVARWRR